MLDYLDVAEYEAFIEAANDDQHKADLDYVWWVGNEVTDEPWILADSDVSYPNPHYVGDRKGTF